MDIKDIISARRVNIGGVVDYRACNLDGDGQTAGRSVYSSGVAKATNVLGDMGK